MSKKLAIGTVQFGMPYGISNKQGQTEVGEVKQILAYAREHGIVTLDTAAAYGSSEAILGHTLRSINDCPWEIVTKTPHFKVNEITNVEISLLHDTFETSLKHLGVEHVHGLLIHACDDLFIKNGHKLYRALEVLKAQGRVNKIGVSVYSSQQIDRLLNEFSIDLVQLPINVFDQRVIEDGSLNRLKKNNVEIHARSVFLQGLLLMPAQTVPSWFGPIIKNIKRFQALAHEMELSPVQLALGFVSTLGQIDRVVLGINKLAHLQEILEAAHVLVDVRNFQDISIRDPMFINPGNWPVKLNV